MSNSVFRGNSEGRQMQDISDAGSELSAHRLMLLLKREKWWIIGSICIALVVATIYLFLAPDVYRVDALLKIQSPQMDSALGGFSAGSGSGSGSGASGALGMLGLQQSPAESAIPVIKSRAVVGRTVKNLDLDIISWRDSFPIFRRSSKENKPTLVLSKFNVSDELLGDKFSIVFAGARSFSVTGPSGKVIGHGQVGTEFSHQVDDGLHISLLVKHVSAQHWPVTFKVLRQPWLQAVKTLQKHLELKPESHGSGVLTIALKGKNKSLLQKTVNSVVANYQRENRRQQSEQAHKTLVFLKTQLPRLKEKVDSAESKLQKFEEKRQPVNLSAQGEALLSQVSNLQDKKSKLKLKIAELEQQYTSKYPAMQAAQNQVAQLREQEHELQHQIDKLPSSQKKLFSLKRNLKVSTELYTNLLSRVQTLRVVQAGDAGNVQVIDSADYPVKPVSPRPKLVLLIGLVLGLVIGIGRVLIRASFERNAALQLKRIRDAIDAPVYAAVPWSRKVARGEKAARKAGTHRPIAARDLPQDETSIALAKARTMISFELEKESGNVLLLNSVDANVGKSFVAINLAVLFAESGKRVLLVDADLSSGGLTNYFASAGDSRGFSDLLEEGVSIAEVLQKTEHDRVDIIHSGKTASIHPGSSTSRKLLLIIEELRGDYEVVIVNAAPLSTAIGATLGQGAVGESLSLLVTTRHDFAENEEEHRFIVGALESRDRLGGIIVNDCQYSPCE